jgi:hypothetical protein
MWQFLIGALIAIVTIIVSIVIYFKQRSRKRLSYRILSNTVLLGVEEEVKKDIQLSYKGKAIVGVRLLVLRIFNSGNVPVVSTDYEKPISIDLGKETRVLTAEVIKKSPPNLQSAISIEDHVVTLYPALLNPADSITTKMLVTKYENGLEVNSRIIGVSRVEELREGSLLTKVILAYLAILLTWLLGSIAWSSTFRVPFFEVFSYFSLIFYAFFALAIVAVSASTRARRSFEKSFDSFTKESEETNEKDKCE